ncbi:thioredoxin-1 [bacterium BMS3Abin10]|nr:thioredoxin-1 [bacterium BMS3Abin10]GBE38954.1 thioredoxin-1 [bacterium BMS3Bbin08]
MSEGVTNVTQDSWDAEVLQSPDLILVDFWAAWCGPCKMVAPMVEELAREYEGKARFVKLNTDENPDLASRYKIRGIPTLMFFKKGEIVEQIVGVVPKAQLKAKIDSLLG